jgi:hypothetical protein
MISKAIKLVIIILCIVQTTYAQNYSQSVDEFIEGKYFKNSQTGLRVKYGYISSLNTYGLTFKNSYGNEFYFMNCSQAFSSDRQYMELTNCMRPTDGSGVGFVKVYKDRIIIANSDGNLTYYLENNNSNSFETKSDDNADENDKAKSNNSSIFGAKGNSKKNTELVPSEIIGKTKKIGKLEIAQYDFSTTMGWDKANEYCSQLGKGWRLPTKNELNIIFKNKSTIGGLAKKQYSESYWSSTKNAQAGEFWWSQNMINGKTTYWGKEDVWLSVRAVRTL